MCRRRSGSRMCLALTYARKKQNSRGACAVCGLRVARDGRGASTQTDEVDGARVGCAGVRDDNADILRRRQRGLRAGQAEAIGRHRNPGARLTAHRDRRPCARRR